MPRVSRRRLARLGQLAVPWGVGLFLAMVALDEFDDPGSAPGALALGLALAVVQGGALHWRRRRPELVMAIVLVAGLGYLLLIPESVIPVAGLFGIGSVAAARPPRVSIPWLVALLAVAGSNFFTTTAEDTTFTMALAVGAWALGEASRNRQAAINEQTRRAVADEQARIARELHDVIAHSVSVIVVQAAAADDVFETRPDQARAALRSIESAGREALRELRLLLGAVRPGEPGGPAAPQPGLSGLDELVEPLRGVGLAVALRREGAVHPLPAGVDLSAYRIVQEALTNTLRHGRATRAEVTVRYGADSVELDVRDDGLAQSGGDGSSEGRGLVGMRERASMLGGTLEAGPLAEGGYRVHAHLPLEAAP